MHLLLIFVQSYLIIFMGPYDFFYFLMEWDHMTY